MRYIVTIEGREIEVDLSGGVPRIDGELVDAELTTLPGTIVRHLKIGVESHAPLARPGPRSGLWTISSHGYPLEVEVLDERTRAIRALTGGAEHEVAKEVVAPMPGLVVRINVQPGEVVTAGQGVIVVEAMKMENELRAPADGVVSRIEVEPGSTVEKGALLIVLE